MPSEGPRFLTKFVSYSTTNSKKRYEAEVAGPETFYLVVATPAWIRFLAEYHN